MTKHDTGEPDEIEVPPLPAEVIARIGRLEPPPPEADFWDRLHLALGADDADTGTAPVPGVSSPSRYRVTLLAVAALVVVAGVGLQLLSHRQPDPADNLPDRGAAATSPDEPVDEPGPTTTAPVVAEEHQPGPPGAGSDVPQPDEVNTSDTGPDGAAATDPQAERVDATAAVDAGTPPMVGSPAPTGTASTAAPQPSSTAARPASPSGPIRLEAEDNDRATSGATTAEGWQLWSNGFIEHVVSLAPGRYSIGVMAQGMATTTTQPRMELRLDGQAVGSTLVSLDSYRLYTFEVTVGPAGAARLEIAFTNDPNRPGNDVDLKIDHTTITPLN